MLFWRKINNLSKNSSKHQPATLPSEKSIFYNKGQSEMFKERFSTNLEVKNNGNYLKAYISDHKVVFYDKYKSEMFKKRFHIDLSDNSNNNEVSIIKDNKELYNGEIVKETNTHVLIKKKIYKK